MNWQKKQNKSKSYSETTREVLVSIDFGDCDDGCEQTCGIVQQSSSLSNSSDINGMFCAEISDDYGHPPPRYRRNSTASSTSFADDYDDDLDIQKEEKFDNVNMKVSAHGGFVSFEYLEPEAVGTPSMELSSSSLSSSSSTGSISTLATLDEYQAEEESEGEQGHAIEFHQEMRKEDEPKFPLMDTNNHKPTDSKQNPIKEIIQAWKLAFQQPKNTTEKEDDYSRTESLTSDTLVQTPRDPLSPKSKEKSLNISLEGKRKTSSSREKSRKEKEEWEEDTRISKISSNSSCSNSLKTSKIIKIRLREEDEIHAAPCQCALRLVGLISASPPTQKWSISNSSAHASVSSGNSITSSPKPNFTPQKIQLYNESAMVRTASGKEPKENAFHAFFSAKPGGSFSAEQYKMTLGGPVSSNLSSLPPLPKKRSHISLFPKMSSPGMFTALHEITLLRSFHVNSSDNLHTADEVSQWRAITIQCNDHDEMDSIIQALKATAKSRVIPFSRNPKARLKRRVENHKRRKEKSSKAILSPPQQKISNHKHSKHLFHKKDNCELCSEPFTLLHRRHHCRKCLSSCCYLCSSIHADRHGKKTRYCKACKNANLSMYKKPGHRFHNNDHCELCTLHFTLLTRRHHCRKCDQSVCSHCSSVIMVKGGEITRYCNRCNNKMRNMLTSTTSASLPGKVHVECNNLGVGVMGKIPHWINFLNTEDTSRPAVARLTVELIEAIALPTSDFYGRTDPYVRATITGYDYDLKWNLTEWFPHKRFSLTSIYCSGTSSPVWLGPGRHGGELLTLPVLRTAGAVLRLEVLHYDVITNAKGKDTVLGVVEIPLADLPNANLRDGNIVTEKGCKSYDGFVDRWYQLHSPLKGKIKDVMLAIPIDDPKNKISSTKNNKKSQGNGMPSWQEISQKAQGVFTAPIDWISSALNLDIPRYPIVNDYHRRSQSAAIHVRLKLNASEIGDLFSHAWFPLVKPKPDIPPYDPQILWSNINNVLKQLDPYLKIIKFCEDLIKWKHSPKTCTIGYLVVALHVIFISNLTIFLHIYLLIFLYFRLREMTSKNISISSSPSFNSTDSESSDKQGIRRQNSFEMEEYVSNGNKHRISQPIESSPISARSMSGKNTDSNANQEAHLNKTVSWIAKILGENRGLEHLQFKLAQMLKDLRNLNSLWDGSSQFKTKASIVCVGISMILHFHVNKRFLWILGITVFHVGNSPWLVIKSRMILGFYRGWAQIIKRRQLHFIELNQFQKGFLKED